MNENIENIGNVESVEDFGHKNSCKLNETSSEKVVIDASSNRKNESLMLSEYNEKTNLDENKVEK